MDATDVLLFSDAPSALWLADQLCWDYSNNQTRRVLTGIESDNSMAVCVRHVKDSFSKRLGGHLFFYERLIRDDADRVNMELVISGTATGLGWLADLIRNMAEKPEPGFEDHEHIDRMTHPDFVAWSNVTLNIRRPVSTWELSSWGVWDLAVTKKSDNFLPSELDDPNDWPSEYCEVSDLGSVIGVYEHK